MIEALRTAFGALAIVALCIALGGAVALCCIRTDEWLNRRRRRR